MIDIKSNQKEILVKLRAAGRSYSEIANTLGIPKNTVKSYCSRNRIVLGGKKIEDANHCGQCGKRLAQLPKRKAKRFCSIACRQKWWNSHRELVVKKTAQKTVCTLCGNTFKSYPQENRKYCSHICYIKDRFGGDHTHDDRAV